MARRNLIRHRGRRKKINSAFDLQLTSMLDILVIILVFLLKSYSTSITQFATVPGIQIPISKSDVSPPDTLQVILTPEGLTFENNRIVTFVQTADSVGGVENATYAFRRTDLDEGGLRILPLFDALTRAREQSELLRAKSQARDESGNPLPFHGVLAIQADKRVNYDTIRKVMYTGAAAGYKTFRLLALRLEM